MTNYANDYLWNFRLPITELLKKTDDADALVCAGVRLFLGLFVEKNREYAFELFSKASGQSKVARILRANCYLLGNGTAYDPGRAFDEYSAVEHFAAVYQRGLCYELVFCEPDSAQSEYSSVLEATSLAKLRYACLLLHGSGCNESKTSMAVSLLKQLEHQGDWRAAMHLSSLADYEGRLMEKRAHRERFVSWAPEYRGLHSELQSYDMWFGDWTNASAGQLEYIVGKSPALPKETQLFLHFLLSANYMNAKAYKKAQPHLEFLVQHNYADPVIAYADLVLDGMLAGGEELSIKLYEQAAKLGQADAPKKCVALLKSLPNAEEILTRLSAQISAENSSDVEFELACTIFFKPNVTNEEQLRAVRLFQKLRNSRPDVRMQLAYCYLTGTGVKFQQEKALYHLGMIPGVAPFCDALAKYLEICTHPEKASYNVRKAYDVIGSFMDTIATSEATEKQQGIEGLDARIVNQLHDYVVKELALPYAHYLFNNQHMDKSMFFYTLSPKAHRNPQAVFNQFRFYFIKRDLEKAFYLFEELRITDVSAVEKHALASIVWTSGVSDSTQFVEKRLELLRRGCTLTLLEDNIAAKFWLRIENITEAINYYEIIGVVNTADFKSHIELCDTYFAAVEGNPDAQFSLGKNIDDSRQINSMIKAAEWYQKAYEGGHIGAGLRLISIYKDLFGDERSAKKRTDMLFDFAQRDEPEALYELGKLLENGVDGILEKDSNEAWRCYVKAAILDGANESYKNALEAIKETINLSN